MRGKIAAEHNERYVIKFDNGEELITGLPEDIRLKVGCLVEVEFDNDRGFTLTEREDQPKVEYKMLTKEEARVEAIEKAARAVDEAAPEMWLDMAAGSAAIPLHLLWSLRVALRGAA